MADLDALVIQLKLETAQLQKGLSEAQGKIAQFGKTAESSANGVKKMHGSSNELLGSLKKMVAVAAVGDFLLEASKAASEDSASFAVLKTQMQNTTGATAKQTQALDEQLDSMGEMSGTKMPEMRTSFESLLRATGSSTKALQLQKMALDLAAGAHVPLATAAKALGKAVNGNQTALTRLDPALKTSKNVLGDLQKQFHGAAQAAGNANPYAKLSVIMEHIKVTLGKALLPLISTFANLLVKLQPIITMVATIIGKVVTAFMPLINELMSALMPVLNVLMRAFMQLVKAVLPPLIKIFNMVVIPIVKLFAKVLSGETIPMIMKLVMAIMPLVNILADILAPILNIIIGFMDKLFTAMKPVYEFVVNGLVKGFKFLTDILGPLWTGVIKPLVDGLLSLLGINTTAQVDVKVNKPKPEDVKKAVQTSLDASMMNISGSAKAAKATGASAGASASSKKTGSGHTINTTINAKTDATPTMIAQQVVNAIKFNLPIVGASNGYGSMGSQVVTG
jgi:phage-related protein